MAFNQQVGNLTRVSSAPTVIQDINFAYDYPAPFTVTGAPQPINVDFQPPQFPPIHPSGVISGAINPVFSNAPLMMPIQGSTHPFLTGPVPRNTGVPPPSTQSPNLEEHQLKRKLSTILQNEQLALFESNTGECQVICGDKCWKVHGYIVAPKCHFLSTALKWKREEGDKTVDMGDDDPQAIDILLRYLYTRNTECVKVNMATFHERAQLLVKVAVVADKYNQPDLMSQVRFELIKWAQFLKKLNPQRGTKDALLALIKLREHDSGCEALRELQRILCWFLTNSGKLQRMDAATTIVLEEAVQTDPALAITLIQYCSGGPSAVPSS